MLKRFEFGEYLPDQPLALLDARNVWPQANGYRPVMQFGGITPALADWQGGGAFVGSDGTAALLSGTATGLYRYSGGGWASVLGSLAAKRWRFEQFGDLAIGVHGGAPVRFNLVGGTAAMLGGAPPASDMAATVRNQLWLAGDPANLVELAISGFGDAEGWTAGTNQCLYVPFQSGGEIMGLAGGETGLVLQKNAIRRGTYTGEAGIWWQFDEISRNIGCMAKGSVAQAGHLVFFLSEQGFQVCDRNSVSPIGAEKIDRTFFAAYSREDIAKINAAVDPRATVVCWSMPGTPGRIWAYNWTLQRWSVIDVSLSGIFPGFTANTSLDAMDGLYPGGLDTVPYSPDDPRFAGGNPLFLIADAVGAVGTLSGQNMAARVAIKPTELALGRRARVRGARAVTDAVQGTVTLDVRARAGDPPKPVASGAIRDNGRVPLRANGRHVGMILDIPASAKWSYVIGLDLEYELEGGR